jgi:tetratricopeptide (TPR) repeat protein
MRRFALALGFAIALSAGLAWGQEADGFPGAAELLPWQREALAGREAQRRGDLEGAAAAYRRALGLSPAQKGLHYQLALIAYYRALYPQAVEECHAELSLGADTADVLNLAGACLVQLQQFDQAALMFRKATEKYPQNANAWNNLAELRRLQKQSQEAATALAHYRSLRPNDDFAALREVLIAVEGLKVEQASQRVAEMRKVVPYAPWLDAAATALELLRKDYVAAKVEWATFLRRAEPDLVKQVRRDTFFRDMTKSPEVAELLGPEPSGN